MSNQQAGPPDPSGALPDGGGGEGGGHGAGVDGADDRGDGEVGERPEAGGALTKTKFTNSEKEKK